MSFSATMIGVVVKAAIGAFLGKIGVWWKALTRDRAIRKVERQKERLKYANKALEQIDRAEKARRRLRDPAFRKRLRDKYRA